MGQAEFGGNGSVQCRIKFNDTGSSFNFDQADQIGLPIANVGLLKGHGGLFRLRLKFDNPAERDAAYAAAQRAGIFLVIDIPAKALTPDQIRVDW